MSLAPRRASVALLLLAVVSATGCRVEPGPQKGTAAPAPPPPTASVPVPASNASSAAPSPAPGVPPSAASAVPDTSAELDDYAKGAENPGCTLRKNSGTLVTCEAYKDNLGTWAPSPREAVAVVQLAGGVCYCAAHLEVPVETCARRVKSGTVKLTVGKEDEPTDCTITISAASWKGRRWVVVDAWNRDRATFYSTLTLQEHSATGFRSYYQGYNGLPEDKAVREGGQGAEGVSPEMRRDWPTLPPALRAAFEHKSP